MRYEPQLILMLGVFAVLSTLPALADIARKKLVLQLLFFLGMGTQITTQGIQFKNATVTQKDLERAEAFAQYAYTERDMVLLNDIAKNRPYFVGYRHFRNGLESQNLGNYVQADKEFAEARSKFADALGKTQFVAQIHYLDAEIEWKKCSREAQIRKCDSTHAEESLKAAINEDKEYAPPYYLQAIIEVNSGRTEKALADLQIAAEKSPEAGAEIVCVDLNNPQEVRDVWSATADDAQFQTIQRKCRDKYPVICKDPLITCAAS
jgi:tetratricopeptide (TPR) repeat protein